MVNVETILNAATVAAAMARNNGDDCAEELLQFLLAKQQKRGRVHARMGSNYSFYSFDRLSPRESFFNGIIPFFGTMFRLALRFGFALFTSCCLYALFYLIYIPKPMQKIVYLDYMHSCAQSEIPIEPSPAPLVSNIKTTTSTKGRNTGNVHSSGSQLINSCREDLFELDHKKSGFCNMEGEEEIWDSVDQEDRLADKRDHVGVSKSVGQNSAVSPWPTAWLDLNTRRTQWESFADDITTPLHYSSSSRLLDIRSAFYFELHLLLPESYTNVNLGVFMLQLELFDDSKKILARSKRPVLFPHSSNFIRYIRKLCHLPPLVLGLFPEATTVTVHAIDHYVDSVSRPLRYAKVVLMLPPRTAENNGFTNNGQVQVLQAKIEIGRELTNIQRAMKQWFYTSMALGVVFFIIMQAILFFTCGLFRGSVRRHHTKQESYSNAGDVDGGSLSLHTLDIDALSSDDVWEVEYDEDEKSHDGEFWDSLSFNNECSSPRIKIAVSSDSEMTSMSSKGKETLHHMKDASTSRSQQKARGNCKLSTPDYPTSSVLPSLNGDKGNKLEGDETPTVLGASRSRRKKLRRNQKGGSSAKGKLAQKLSSQHEDERVQRILKGDVEPYEIFTDLDDPDLQANIYDYE